MYHLTNIYQYEGIYKLIIYMHFHVSHVGTCMFRIVLLAAADDILSVSLVAFTLNTTLLNSRSTLVENS